MDGHNVIGRVPALEHLQAGDRGEEARTEVIRACLGFALRRKARVILVFDGRPGHGSGGGPNSPHLEVVYASGPGGADARIIARANRLVGGAEPVTVVTDDRGIRNELLRGIACQAAGAFWKEAAGRESPSPSRRAGAGLPAGQQAGGDDKPSPGSMPDIDRHFLELEADQAKRRKR